MKNPTAAEAYKQQQERVAGLLKRVEAHLADHANRQAADSKNWGFVGDLTHYANQLAEILGEDAEWYAVGGGR
jgi:hypothetical protein